MYTNYLRVDHCCQILIPFFQACGWMTPFKCDNAILPEVYIILRADVFVRILERVKKIGFFKSNLVPKGWCVSCIQLHDGKENGHFVS